MQGMLKAFGGKGKTDDGTPLYRLIVGNVYPLGIGFTMKPAANVKGIISEETVKEETEEVKAIEINTDQSKELEKIAAKISQNLKNKCKFRSLC